jgi:hypothetical protein
MPPKPRAAFVTARKGFCYLTIKTGRWNRHILRIRDYAIDAQDKRDLRRRYPEIAFDWKKIDKQLAEKRQACRRYRSRRRTPSAGRRPAARQPLYAVYDPLTRAVYADVPSDAAGAGALLDAVLAMDRASPLPAPPGATPKREPGSPYPTIRPRAAKRRSKRLH